MAEFTFVSGNTRPFFAVQLLKQADYQPINLVGASVVFFMRKEGNETATPEVNNAACTITDAALGKVEYRWQAADLDKPGMFTAEFRVTFSDGTKQSVMIERVEIKEKLG